MPVWVFHWVTKETACSISLSQSSGVHLFTPFPSERVEQKCPLKWVPISWPASQAWLISFSVLRTAPSDRNGMSDAPCECFGGWYSDAFSFGSV